MLLLVLATQILGCAGVEPTAAPIPLLAAEGLTLDCLDVVIDGAVDEDAIRRALRTKVGAPFAGATWRGDLQSLANLGFFRRLETEVLRAGAGHVALRLHVRTSWSLLPFLGYEGGPVPVVIVGAYYADLFGEMLDVGGYYMRRGPYDLGRAWATLPHQLLPRSLLDVELVMTGELRPEYRRGAWRVPASGFEVLRRGGYADFGWQPVPDLVTLSARYALLRETTVTVDNLPAVVADDSPLARGARAEARLSVVSVTALLGQIDLVDSFVFRGHELRLVVLGSTRLAGSSRDFALAYAAYRGFTELTRDLALGVRLTAAHSTSADHDDDLVIGGYNLEPFVYGSKYPGLLTVRGVRAGLLSGPELALANLELRQTLVRDVDLPLAGGTSLQLAAFVDAGSAGRGGARALARDTVVTGGFGLLLTLLDFRYTYVDWYVARVFRPYTDNVFNIVVMRPFF